MRILIGSIIVVLLATLIAWFLLSFLFKPIGLIIGKQATSFKNKLNEKDKGENDNE